MSVCVLEIHVRFKAELELLQKVICNGYACLRDGRNLESQKPSSIWAIEHRWRYLSKSYKRFFVYFRVSLRVHGSAYRWFSPSPSIVWQVSLVTGRLANSPALLLYTGPDYRVIWRVRKENDFASKVTEQESNSSYTARVDPFPSTLSIRPTSLPFSWVLTRQDPSSTNTTLRQ